MKNTRRALRRHHRQRMIAYALRSFKVVWLPRDERRQWALRFCNTMQRCSCWMCGHRRKIWGPAARDLKQSHAAAYELDDMSFDE